MTDTDAFELVREDSLAPAVDPFEPDVATMQAELVRLSLWRLRREMIADPGAQKLSIGQGNPSEQTITGNAQDPYNGVVIYNPTPATLSVGFQVGTGVLSPATVPPYSWASFPERYTNLSIALLNPADQASAIATPVTILRTRVPPVAGAGAFGAPYAGQTPAPAALVSLVGQSAVAHGLVLDLGYPRPLQSMVINATGAPTAGGVTLDVSHDNITWFTPGAAVNIAAVGVFGQATPAPGFPARYVRASVSTAITAGAVSVTVAGS